MFGLEGAKYIEERYYSKRILLTPRQQSIVGAIIKPFDPMPLATQGLIECLLAHSKETNGTGKYPYLSSKFDVEEFITWANQIQWPFNTDWEQRLKAMQIDLPTKVGEILTLNPGWWGIHLNIKNLIKKIAFYYHHMVKRLYGE